MPFHKGSCELQNLRIYFVVLINGKIIAVKLLPDAVWRALPNFELEGMTIPLKVMLLFCDY